MEEPAALISSQYVVHRQNAPKEAIKTLKFGDRGSDWICVVCSRGFANEKSAREHASSDLHKTKVQDDGVTRTLSELVSPSNEHVSCVTDLVELVFQQQSASGDGTSKIREEVTNELRILVQREFPDVTVRLHGSTVSHFALLTSDVNINLAIPELESQHQKNVAVVMKRVSAMLHKKTKIYSSVQEDYFAYNKIPRIIFKHTQSKLTGEIRVNVGNPLALAHILHLYHSLDCRVSQLGVLFRYWAKVCRVDRQENGHYPAHMFIVMTIYFLQQQHPPVVPVLHELYPELEQKEHPTAGDDLEVIRQVASKISWKSSNSQTLGQLWLGLLKYYAVDFQVEKHAVSILHSRLMLREDTSWGVYRLAVQDPMIPRSNLARAASSDKVFSYLWSSIKQSAVYFHTVWGKKSDESLFLRDMPVSEQTLVSDHRTLVCGSDKASSTQTSSRSQGNSPDHAPEDTHSPSLTVSSDHAATPSGPGQTSTQSSAPGSSNASNSATVPESCHSVHASGFSISESTSGVEEVCIDFHKLAIKDNSNSTSDAMVAGASSSSSAAETSEGAKATGGNKQGKTSSKKKKAEFKVAHLAYQKYPLVCLGCKRLHHNIFNCPAEKLPSWNFPKIVASPASLKSIKKAFRKHLRDTVLKEEDKLMRQEICDMILSYVKELYPDARLELFGSSANGFSSYKSDLDICLSLPQISPETMDKASQNEIIETLAKKLKRIKDFHEIITITTARVPIIKFYLPYYRLECDISLENRLALRNTKLIFAYASLDERVRHLGYAIKHFAKTCDMGDASTGSLSSYAYILMTIHYLQRTDPPVLPCLQQIPPRHPDGPQISGWDCYYYENVDSLSTVWPHCGKNQETVGQLWLGFLRYYLTFDWAKEVVTIRQLDPLSKFDKWWFSKLMCIEDPFNLDHNLAASIGAKMKEYILERFYKAFCHHSREMIWRDIDSLFDPRVLVGNARAPKFLICNFCNCRGHKAVDCPEKKQMEKMKRPGKHADVRHVAATPFLAQPQGQPALPRHTLVHSPQQHSPPAQMPTFPSHVPVQQHSQQHAPVQQHSQQHAPVRQQHAPVQQHSQQHAPVRQQHAPVRQQHAHVRQQHAPVQQHSQQHAPVQQHSQQHAPVQQHNQQHAPAQMLSQQHSQPAQMLTFPKPQQQMLPPPHARRAQELQSHQHSNPGPLLSTPSGGFYPAYSQVYTSPTQPSTSHTMPYSAFHSQPNLRSYSLPNMQSPSLQQPPLLAYSQPQQLPQQLMHMQPSYGTQPMYAGGPNYQNPHTNPHTGSPPFQQQQQQSNVLPNAPKDLQKAAKGH